MDAARLSPALAEAIGAALGEKVSLSGLARLEGGAIQENWGIDAATAGGEVHRLVLRMDARSRIAIGHARAREHAILAVAWRAGMRVPEPIGLVADASVLGKGFAIMRRLDGTAWGRVIVDERQWRGDRGALARDLGAQLACLHAITPPRAELDFLGAPPVDPALAAIAEYRAHLDAMGEARPALEWALRALERRAPRCERVRLCHRDFRTGNYLVDAGGLTGVLDWEFAGWSDPDEDLGWFCARCWRFGRVEREAGGIASIDDLLAGYEAVAGRRVDRGRLAYWQAMAHARWAVIALMQGRRHVSGEEPSIDLALTGRRIAEIEHEALRLTAPAAA